MLNAFLITVLMMHDLAIENLQKEIIITGEVAYDSAFDKANSHRNIGSRNTGEGDVRIKKYDYQSQKRYYAPFTCLLHLTPQEILEMHMQNVRYALFEGVYSVTTT